MSDSVTEHCECVINCVLSMCDQLTDCLSVLCVCCDWGDNQTHCQCVAYSLIVVVWFPLFG